MKSFNDYWKLGEKSLQKTYIKGLINVEDKNRGTTESSKRTKTFNCHLKKDNTKISVFLSTYSRSDKFIRTTIAMMDSEITVVKARNPTHSRGFKWSNDNQQYIASFLAELPKKPSHYCRKDTKTLYLEQIFTTTDELCDAYVKRCADENRTPFPINMFLDCFHESNYALFHPKIR